MDQDGKIYYHEFVRWICQVLETGNGRFLKNAVAKMQEDEEIVNRVLR